MNNRLHIAALLSASVPPPDSYIGDKETKKTYDHWAEWLLKMTDTLIEKDEGLLSKNMSAEEMIYITLEHVAPGKILRKIEKGNVTLVSEELGIYISHTDVDHRNNEQQKIAKCYEEILITLAMEGLGSLIKKSAKK